MATQNPPPKGKGLKGMVVKPASAKGPPPPLHLRFSDLADPPLAGYANRWSFVEDGLFWHLQFQLEHPGQPPTVLASVVMGCDDVATGFGSTLIEFRDKVVGVFRSAELEPIGRSEFLPSLNTAGLAHVVRVSRSGLDGLFEFFSVHTYSIIRYEQQRTAPTVTGLFAVQLPTQLIVGFLEGISPRLEAARERISRFPVGVS